MCEYVPIRIGALLEIPVGRNFYRQVSCPVRLLSRAKALDFFGANVSKPDSFSSELSAIDLVFRFQMVD
jgi:hypothetical protein